MEVPDLGDIWAGEKSVGRVLGWVVAKGAGRGLYFFHFEEFVICKAGISEDFILKVFGFYQF